MNCHDCDVEMNHHADKVNYTSALDDPDHRDPYFGGIIEEAHTCAGCGKTELQRAD